MFWPTDVLAVESWVFLFSSFLLLRYYTRRKWSALKQWNIPHDPPSLFDLGNTRTVLSNKLFSLELVNKKKYGPIWGYYNIFEPRIVIHDLEILKQVCVKEFSTFPNRLDVCMVLLGKETSVGLLSANGNRWRRSRTTLAPVFSSSKLREMSRIVDHCVDNTLKVFEGAIAENDGEFVSGDVFSRVSMDVICSSAFSVDVNSQDPKKNDTELVKQAKNYIAASFLNFLNFVVMTVPFLEPLCIWIGGLRKSVVYFKATCKHMMKERSGGVAQGRTDLMSLMLESKVTESHIKDFPLDKGLTTDEIIGNAMTMLLAGYETTSNAMNYLAYNLAFHPEIQSKVQAEIDELYSLKKGNPNFSDIDELRLLGMCINESLRLYPPVPRTLRTAKKNITLSGLTIPKGWVVCIPINALAHDPEHWDDPMEFKPERMRNPSEFHPMLFQPFGMGPRNCIGSKFALMEMKLAFAKILRNFSFQPTSGTPNPPLELIFGGTTRPKVNFNLRVVSRS